MSKSVLEEVREMARIYHDSKNVEKRVNIAYESALDDIRASASIGLNNCFLRFRGTLAKEETLLINKLKQDGFEITYDERLALYEISWK